MKKGPQRGRQAFLDPEHRSRRTLGAGTAAQRAPKTTLSVEHSKGRQTKPTLYP